jgi:hypothetical protein
MTQKNHRKSRDGPSATLFKRQTSTDSIINHGVAGSTMIDNAAIIH